MVTGTGVAHHDWPDHKPGRPLWSCLITVLPHDDPTQAGATRCTPTNVENTMTPMLADKVDFVIGVDTHRDSHTAAIITATGGLVERFTVATDAFGFRKLDTFAATHATGRRVWASEGTGSFGAGLTTHLLDRGEWVVEIDHPKRRHPRRDGAKSDDLDAVPAAREALTREHLAAARARGDREAMRVLLTAREGATLARTKAIGQLKAMIVNAPQSLRDQLRRGTTDEQLNRCARLRTLPSHSVEHRATVRAIRATARRALMLEAEAAEHQTELERLVAAACPQLLDRPGTGVITAAQFLISWSHRARVRNEAAFAALAGAAPIPASSDATLRHRLNRAGDRQLNRALHTVALTRLRFEPTTKTSAARRTAEGKTPRDSKRAIAREIYRVMQAHAHSIATTETEA